MVKLDLSESGLRKRIHKIAEDIGNEGLKEMAQTGYLSSIIEKIIEDEIVEPVVKSVFADFPYSDTIINSILKYKEIPEALKYVMLNIGETAHRTRNPEAVRRVAESFQSEEVLETMKAYQGLEEIDMVADAIGNTTYWTGDPKAVREVAKSLRSKVLETIKAYQGLEGIDEVVSAIRDTIYWTRDPEAVRRVAESFQSEEVLETMKAYQGSERIDEVARVIGDTAYWTRDPEAVKEVARKYLQELK